MDRFASLRKTLTAIANGQTASRIDDPMPWAFQKASSLKPEEGHAPPTVKGHS
jgi:hypothetical protein